MPLPSLTLLLAVVLSAQVYATGIPTGRQLLGRDTDPLSTTDPSQFYRRAWHNSVLLGEVLYIDGGEFTYDTSTGPVPYPYNSTYAMDLSVSWSPATVTLNKIDKGASPVFNTPDLWPASDNKSFYLFNGDITLAGQHRSDPPKVPELWQFTPNGITQGSWRRVGFATSLIGATRAKSTFGNGSVHIMGGFAFDRSSGAISDIIATPGLVSYDTSTGQWQNRSLTPYVSSGSALDGNVHFFSNLGGKNGIVLAFGGVNLLNGGQAFTNFETIGLFNPELGQWQVQNTTGDIPPNRRLACSVGVAGDNGTYEIFMHGGSAFSNDNYTGTVPQATISLDQVWVLSLPSFVWFKTTTYNAADPRWAHTCHIPGNPARSQLVSIGGVTPDQDRSYESKDPRPQGIGVFDLTTLTWVTTYNARAPTYTTPKMVKDHINANGLYPANWDSSDTAVWVTGKTPQELLEHGTSNHTSPSQNHKLPAATIAGVAVGAVVLLTLVCLAVAYWRGWPIRRRQERQKVRHSNTIWSKPELASNSVNERLYAPEKDGSGIGTYEVSGQSSLRYEMPGSMPEPVEMSGGTVSSELPATSRKSRG